MKRTLLVLTFAGLLVACGSSTEPPVASVVVTGTVRLGGAPVGSGSVELYPADLTTVHTVETIGMLTIGSAGIEDGSYRVSAEVINPGFCDSVTISVLVDGASGTVFHDTRRLGRCGEHVGVDFAF